MAAHAVVDAGHRPMQGTGDRISLTGITAFGYHGVFDAERRQGQKFVVDVSCLIDLSSAASNDDLGDTIDYAALFEIINTTMQKPVDLLETLVQTLASEVHRAFSQTKEIKVSVEKLNPPIDKFTGTATVSYIARF